MSDRSIDTLDLILIRHPSVAEGSLKLCYGSSDVAIAGETRLEAEAFARRLEGAESRRPTEVHASPLQRCAGVAEILAERYGCDLTFDKRLQEMHFGDWELQHWDHIERSAIDAWVADLEQARPHGGENITMMAARAGAWLNDFASASPAEGSARRALVVSHAGLIRVLTAQALHLPISASLKWPLGFGGIVHLQLRAPGEAWVLAGWNG
jgi:alpha-ribazole phosphatase